VFFDDDLCGKEKNYNLIQKKKKGTRGEKGERREKEKKRKREKREKSYRYYLVLSDNLNIERLRFGSGYDLFLRYYLGILWKGKFRIIIHKKREEEGEKRTEERRERERGEEKRREEREREIILR
jgi:hypothetical protein